MRPAVKGPTCTSVGPDNIINRIMNEPIHMPGFPEIIVTRAFCYQWLKSCGWDNFERGFGSIDYLAFGRETAYQPLTPERDRDRWLTEVRKEYLRS